VIGDDSRFFRSLSFQIKKGGKRGKGRKTTTILVTNISHLLKDIQEGEKTNKHLK